MNLFLILRLNLIISTDFLTNNVQHFPQIASSFNLATNKTVTTINFDEQLIAKLIVALNANKVHGDDGLSIRLLQISKPLSIIFQNCRKAGYFPEAWKKTNVVPIHRKGNKQILNNYLPVSFYLWETFLKKSI